MPGAAASTSGITAVVLARTRTLRSASPAVLPAVFIVLLPALVGQSPPRPAPPAPDRVAVPAGDFVMGSDTLGEQDERPQHTASTGAFAIDRLEVSQRNYHACISAGVCAEPRPLDLRFISPEQPAVGVRWDDAAAYCRWAGGRLPTEVEWEKAARGTDGRLFPWGNDRPDGQHATFGRGADGAPDPVGSHPRGASPYGALDMAGNVWEWTASVYDPYAYQHADTAPTCETALASLADLRARGIQGFTGTNPLPVSCERVLRGGAWNYGGDGLRSSNRVHHPPHFRLTVAGFRCAADVAP